MKRQLMKMVYGCVMVLLVVVPGVKAAVTVVNIDFGLHGDHPAGATSVGYSGVAAAPDTGTVWNNIEVVDNNAFHGPPGEFGWWSASVSQSNLLSSQGVATPIGVNIVGGGEPNTGAFAIVSTATNNLAAIATDARDLMRDYIIGFGDPRTVELSGFAPFAAVDLYLYGAGDTDNRDTVFTVTDILGTHSAATTGTITPDVNNPQVHTLTLGGDYVVLAGVLADASGKINILYDNSVGSGEGPFNGLQAIYMAIPEPTSFMLTALGVMALISRKWR